MTKNEKIRFWGSLSGEGKEQFKDNLENMKKLIETFDLVPDKRIMPDIPENNKFKPKNKNYGR